MESWPARRSKFITTVHRSCNAPRPTTPWPRPLNRLDRYALLVIDDIGYVRKDEAETSVLCELVIRHYERRSLLVTSNQPFSEWENVFSTSAMTVAAVDRLVDHSTIVQISGESYRRKRARRMAS